MVLKVDVEGGELAVLRGAQESLSQADRFLVLFEAHPRHVQRTGVDPCELIKLIQDIRPCRVTVSERPGLDLALDKPFIETVGPDRIYNVCVYTP